MTVLFWEVCIFLWVVIPVRQTVYWTTVTQESRSKVTMQLDIFLCSALKGSDLDLMYGRTSPRERYGKG